MPLLQFNLLHYLAARPGRIYSRQELMRDVWKKPNPNPNACDKKVDVQVHELRNAIEVDPSSPRIIRTVKGLGFKFDQESADQQL